MPPNVHAQRCLPPSGLFYGKTLKSLGFSSHEILLDSSVGICYNGVVVLGMGKPARLHQVKVLTRAQRLEIKRTLKLDHCWICQDKDGLEEHHVVPRHCGGETGPTVTLCGICHYNTHQIRIPQYVKYGTQYITQLCSKWKGSGQVDQAVYLASVISKANEISKGSDHRPVKYMTTLDAATHRMLKLSAKGLGLTQDQVVKEGIKVVYMRHIGH